MEAKEPVDVSEQTRWMIAVRDSGDRAAYARLFDFYAPRVKALAMRGGSPAGAAEDIAQDVMLRVWQSRAQYDPSRAPVSGWIYQIARNRRIDVARRAPQALPEDIAAAPGPEEAAAVSRSSRRRRDCATRCGRCRRDSARWSSGPTSAS